VWLPDPPSDDPLRQGDLIDDVPFPDVSGEPMIEDGTVTLPVAVGPALLVTQCCDIQQKDVARVARVAKINNPRGRAYEAITGVEPVEPDEDGFVRYSTRFFALDPVGPLSRLDERYLWVAMLLETMEYRGDLSWLLRRRVARMTPEERRTLRTKLMLSGGRTTDEDADYLLARGEQEHFVPAPRPSAGSLP